MFRPVRRVSASRLAFNSLRVMRTLAVLGQAAGTAAAYSAAQGRLPADLTPADIGRIQQRLLRQDGTILRLPAADPDDLARGARATASSTAPWPAEFALDSLSVQGALAQLVPVTADRVDRVELALSNATSADTVIRVSACAASDVWDVAGLRSAALASAECTVSPGPVRWVECALGVGVVPGRLYWVRVEAPAGVSWHFSCEVVPGATAARLDGAAWRFAPGSFHVWRHFAIRVDPATVPFAPETVTNGVARPEAWPNLWMSDPGQPLPQWLMVEFARPGPVAEVHVVLDTDITRPYMQRPPFFRAPECVRDFDLALRERGQWRLVAPVRGNYQRFLRLPVTGAGADAAKLTVLATNGAAAARVYAVRVYRQ